MIAVLRCTRLAVVALCGLAGCAVAPRPALQWRHPHGLSRYRLEVVEQNPEGTRHVVFDLQLRVDADASYVELLSGHRVESGAARPIELPADCPEAAPGVLARLSLRPPIDLDAAVPACVPEPLFGGLTDALTFALLQADPAFGLEALAAVGDEVAWPGFTTSWHRPPALLAAEVACPGGTTRLVALEDGIASCVWRPQPIELGLVRTTGTRGARMLLAGREHLEIEIRIDTHSGRLLGGEAVRDELELALWPTFSGSRVPPAEQRPRGAGLPVRIQRTLRLELVEGGGDPADS